LTDLCANDSASAEDRRALAKLVDGLPQARDTTAVIHARKLLDKGSSNRRR